MGKNPDALIINNSSKHPNIRASWSALLLILFAFLVVGCSRAPIYLQFDQTKQSRSHDPSPPSQKTCAVIIQAVEDKRELKDILGIVGWRTVYADNFPEWVIHQIKMLDSFGYAVNVQSTDNNPGVNCLNLSVVIRTAYIRTFSASIAATVVAEVSYSRDMQLLGKKMYRGNKTKVNWNSSENEVNGIFSEVFAQILKSISNDLAQYC